MRDVVRTLRDCERVLNGLADLQTKHLSERNRLRSQLHADPLPDEECPIRKLALDCREIANHLERTD